MAEYVTLTITGDTENTVDVPVIPGSVSDGDRLISGGFESTASLVMNIRTGHFLTADSTEVTVDSDFFTADNSTARPRAGKTCTFRGVEYRILRPSEDATRAYFHLILGPTTQ